MDNTFSTVVRWGAGFVMAVAVSGCAGGLNTAQTEAVPHSGLASNMYLDGTRPVSEQPRPRRMADNRPATTAPAVNPAQNTRAQDISASQTSGSRTNAAPRSGTPNTAFTDEWWDKERREDARLKSKMSICKGC